ncbi:MAG: septum formation initiator family protein [Candidatus Omnitrophica bacterium]|nr:septum formation initiator family protein [Candidatus Omnitrophota bacterium]
MRKPAAVVIFALLAAAFVMLLAPRALQVRKLRIQSKNLDAEIQRLQLENRALEEELRLLRDDPVYLEKVAREKFNKARQGEIVYKVVRQDGS